MTTLSYAHPILTCEQARVFEPKVLPDEAAEWAAMKHAGVGIAQAVVRDYLELCDLPENLRVIALIGKGNNAGDALIACGQLLADFPRASVSLLLTADDASLKPLAKRAFDQLEGRVQKHFIEAESDAAKIGTLLDEISDGHTIDICIDGLLGVAFSAPIREPMRALIEAINDYDSIRLRAAVDLPSGQGDEPDELTYRADFTYATGIAKQALFKGIAECGRVRFIDLGFFDSDAASDLDADDHILTPDVLSPMQVLRPAAVDKRKFGHLFIVGGSAYMPGALLMAVQAALRSGVGLVTAFAPASVAASLSAQVPEAMWVPWPETANGTLNPRAMPLLLERIGKASAVLCGPGLGRDRNTEMVAQEIIKLVQLPVILDADALRQKVLGLTPRRKRDFGPVVVTPHMGEFMRIAKLSAPDYTPDTLVDFCQNYRLMTVLKAAHTRICDGDSILYNACGGPVLSRGGSGDLLAGLIGGMVAQDNVDTLTAVARGVVLHGLSAQLLAQSKGQIAVSTTQVLDYIPKVLRGELA